MRRRRRRKGELNVHLRCCVRSSHILTWMILCMCGMRRSMRTSSSMTRALHTFFRTSLSSSPASANRLWTWKRQGEKERKWGGGRENREKDGQGEQTCRETGNGSGKRFHMHFKSSYFTTFTVHLKPGCGKLVSRGGNYCAPHLSSHSLITAINDKSPARQ